MENKKYAPLIGKQLTWEMLDSLLSDVRADVVREFLNKPKPSSLKRDRVIVRVEEDGS